MNINTANEPIIAVQFSKLTQSKLHGLAIKSKRYVDNSAELLHYSTVIYFLVITLGT